MAETDTSSYPKGAMPVSMLDIADKIGGLQQQKLGIDQAKLDQANQALGYMVRAMGSLGPNAKKEDYAKAAQNAVDQGLVPQQQENIFLQHLQAAPDSQSFYKQFMTSAMEGQKQIEMHTGINSEKNDNATNYQGKTDVLTGGFKPATQMPVQIPPGTPNYDENNQQVLTPPAGPAGVVPVPRPRPGLAGLTTGPTGPTVETTGGPGSPPATFAQRTDAAFPKPLKAGPSPLFPEGKEAYTKDQLAASGRLQSIKPAIQALKLMPGIASGPGTEQINNLIATAKALGIIDIKESNDPTAIRQEINKKLAQYVGNNPNVSRSDASQALAEAGSPSAKTQISPALQALTRDAVALDRVKILQPQAFKGTDYQNYIKHQGTFPGSVDEKALTLDLLPEKERNNLVTKMATQYKNGDAGEKKIASKFLDTLKLAKEHGIYEGM